MEYTELSTAPSPPTSKAARAVHEAILAALAADLRTQEPMNALIVWTELGKGLAGKLDRQGADIGLLGRLCAARCAERSDGVTVNLLEWAYRVAPSNRLSHEALSQALSRVERAIGDRLSELWADGDGGAHMREDFLATARGWFPVGVEIMKAMPAAVGRTDAEVHAALGAWCDRFLPKDESGPEELGVRKERGGAEVTRC